MVLNKCLRYLCCGLGFPKASNTPMPNQSTAAAPTSTPYRSLPVPNYQMVPTSRTRQAPMSSLLTQTTTTAKPTSEYPNSGACEPGPSCTVAPKQQVRPHGVTQGPRDEKLGPGLICDLSSRASFNSIEGLAPIPTPLVVNISPRPITSIAGTDAGSSGPSHRKVAKKSKSEYEGNWQETKPTPLTPGESDAFVPALVAPKIHSIPVKDHVVTLNADEPEVQLMVQSGVRVHRYAHRRSGSGVRLSASLTIPQSTTICESSSTEKELGNTPFTVAVSSDASSTIRT